MMLRTRILPALLLDDDVLVKTKNFKNPQYIGDPCNTVRIFNELEVDELMFLDISATPNHRGPNFKILKEIADECFMPLGYGGGITNFEQAQEIFKIGFEKIAINTSLHKNLSLLEKLQDHFGSQSIIASIDVKKGLLGKESVWTKCGKENTKVNPVEFAKLVESKGAGEILLTSINQEGTWGGLDIDLIKKVSEAVSIPVIAQGGANSVDNICDAVITGGASAVALGSMVVYQKQGMGVLVNFPDRKELFQKLYPFEESSKLQYAS